MSTRPYRTPSEVKEGAAPAEERSLGSVRSVHRPAPTHKALAAPILIPLVMLGIMCISSVPVWIGSIIAITTFAFLAWSPFRMRGLAVTLHTEGVVVARGATRAEVHFEDVDEVWFDLDSLRWNQLAVLRALRLVDFDGRAHHVPLTVNDGVMLANAILRGCGGPLLGDARKALLAGKMLSFGTVHLSRAGLTVKGQHAPWQEIRRALVQPGRISFYRRSPLFAWRTIKLDRIPNPNIFCALVGDCVKLVTDGPLAIESLASTATLSDRRAVFRSMFIGGAAFLVGLILTANSLLCGRVSFVTVGVMIFGAIYFVRGVSAFRRNR